MYGAWRLVNKFTDKNCSRRGLEEFLTMSTHPIVYGGTPSLDVR